MARLVLLNVSVRDDEGLVSVITLSVQVDVVSVSAIADDGGVVELVLFGFPEAPSGSDFVCFLDNHVAISFRTETQSLHLR